MLHVFFYMWMLALGMCVSIRIIIEASVAASKGPGRKEGIFFHGRINPIWCYRDKRERIGGLSKEGT